MRKIIAFVAGKGGVGKSATTVNTALALQACGYKVGILDADIYGPSVPKMLPAEVFPVPSADNPEEIIPADAGGVKIISIAYFQPSDAMVVRAPIANGVILQFLQKVVWGDLDYLLIDFPPGTGDIQLTLMQEGVLSGAIIVTTPQEIALLDVRKAVQMLEEMKVPILGVVENMSYLLHGEEKIFPFGRGGGRKLAEARGIPFLEEIPMDGEINFCLDNGISIFSHPKTEQVAKTFTSLVGKIEEVLDQFQQESHGCLEHFELTWQAWKNDFVS